MSPQPRPSRRAVLAGALAGALAGLLPLGGCTLEPQPPPPPDPLEPLIRAAAAHAELAEAVATAHPVLASAAGLVAGDRRVHAEVMTAEVRRATPSPSPTSTVAATSGPQAPPADPAAAKAALAQAAQAGQRQAAELVGTLPRYRAGLVASVAAGCASLAVVLT